MESLREATDQYKILGLTRIHFDFVLWLTFVHETKMNGYEKFHDTIRVGVSKLLQAYFHISS